MPRRMSVWPVRFGRGVARRKRDDALNQINVGPLQSGDLGLSKPREHEQQQEVALPIARAGSLALGCGLPCFPVSLMLAQTLDQIRSSPSKSAAYERLLLAGLVALVLAKTFRLACFNVGSGRDLTDFDVFHFVAQRVWHGDLDLVYRFETLAKIQAEAGARTFMPWTYPPQFDLLLAPLGFLPVWLAYALFIASTLALYLVTMRRIAREYFVPTLIVIFPALTITITSGQNGLLTGSLIGAVCLNAGRRQWLAGLALGAMVIKPHLAVAAGVYLLLTRRFVALTIAVTVVLVSSAICTLLFGAQIWTALLGAVRESAILLEGGFYLLFRMVSSYAALLTAGVPAAWALVGQALTAAFALFAVALAVARQLSQNWTIGITAIASVMISPYAHDYDLPILGIGLALLLPDLAKLASWRERNVAFGLVLLAGGYGMLQSVRLENFDPIEHPVPAVAGFALLALLGLLLRILARKRTVDVPVTDHA